MQILKLGMAPPPFPYMKRPVPIALIGGAGGFFGRVHLLSASLSRSVEIVAGALHEDPQLAVATAAEWGIPRPFRSIEELAGAARELNLAGVIVSTRNDQHRAHCETFLNLGVNVFCEKPLTAEPADAIPLVKLARKTGLACGVNFTYLGNPTWFKAAYMARCGGIGSTRKVEAAYSQGWLINPLGVWREKRAMSGPFGSGHDIGVHCLSSVVFVTGQLIDRVRCNTITHIPGREVDDDFVLEGYTTGGVPFTVRAMQIDTAGINDHSLTVLGSEGTITVSQVNTEQLHVDLAGSGHETLYRGQDYSKHPRLARFFAADPGQDYIWRSLPGNHPPGLYGAIANNIAGWSSAIQRQRDGISQPDEFCYPDFELGGHLMMVLGAAVTSRDETGGKEFVPVEAI
jgi:predicted dehydrogenase